MAYTFSHNRDESEETEEVNVDRRTVSQYYLDEEMNTDAAHWRQPQAIGYQHTMYQQSWGNEHVVFDQVFEQTSSFPTPPASEPFAQINESPFSVSFGYRGAPVAAGAQQQALSHSLVGDPGIVGGTSESHGVNRVFMRDAEIRDCRRVGGTREEAYQYVL
jgi:hypothetical protein